MISAVMAIGILVAQTQPEPVANVNEPFTQESSMAYPMEDVIAIVLGPDGWPVAATANGLERFDGAAWKSMDGPGFPATLLRSIDKSIWASDGKSLSQWDGKNWGAVAMVKRGQITDVALSESGILVATTDGLASMGPAGIKPIAGITEPIEALTPSVAGQSGYAISQGRLYAVQEDRGTFALKLETVSDANYSWAPISTRALVTAGDGIWFASKNGVGRLDAKGWKLYTGKEGLPYDHFTCAAPGEDGVVWFGTERGAVRFDGQKWAYRAGRRWLPDNHVNAIAVAKDGAAWIATPKGIACIERKKMTLAEKAAWYEKIVDERHTRLGYVVHSSFKEEGNPATNYINATDNDGLYTGMYGAAEAFRYAATKDPGAKARAKRSFEALKLLVDVTGVPGFPARAVLPTDWPSDPNAGMGAEFNKAEKAKDPAWKEILPRWPKSADGKYWWKCDTSSDEIAGHYFFYGVYYDLAAETPEEKAAVVGQVRAMTNHIVDHNFALVDHDGKPTRWGNWSPEYVNSMDGGWADRGLQAVEILSFLKVACHVTGDQKFEDAAKYLREKYSYHINAVYGRRVFPPDFVVPWDDNLAFLSYYGLLKYEKEPQLLRAYRQSLDANWLFRSRANDPFFNFIYAAALPDKDKPVAENNVYADFPRILAKGVETLRGAPLMLVGWEMKNSHRLDVTLDSAPRQRPGYGWSAITHEALPIEERCHIRINSDHFDLNASRGGGFGEYEGTFYLLPYYMGAYHGFLR